MGRHDQSDLSDVRRLTLVPRPVVGDSTLYRLAGTQFAYEASVRPYLVAKLLRHSYDHPVARFDRSEGLFERAPYAAGR